jgi:hypothetical protein
LRSFASDTFANALGTLIAAAVIYLVGVLTGAFTFELLVALLAAAAGLVSAALAYVAYARATRPLSEAETAELNRILEVAKRVAQERPDGSEE